MINKGVISSLQDGGKMAVVIPQEASGTVTFPLTVPVWLLECLSVQMPVVYVTFPDNTGMILSRLDGEWNHKIFNELTIDGKAHVTGPVTADNGISAAGGISATGGGDVAVSGNITLTGSITASGDVSAGGISLKGHTHSGVQSGGSNTGTPS